MAKMLRVNMTNLTAEFEEVPEQYARWAGRGLTSAVVAAEVPPMCHPLCADNKLVIAPGWVSGTKAPSSGRLSFGGKSPLTGTIKESNAGGIASQKLARLGIRAIVIEGQPQDPKGLYTLTVSKKGATVDKAKGLKKKGMYKVDEKLREKHGKVAVIGIGPAGEMKMSNAGISVNDMENRPGRYAGRGGLGAVMGAKGLKAIIIDDAGAGKVEIASKAVFDRGCKKLAQALRTHDVTKKGGGLNTYGTAVLVNIMNESGGLPTRNFSSGRFEGAANTSGEAINEIVAKRGGEGMVGHACHPGCIIKCSNIFPKRNGKHHVSCVEYESSWAFGANCGIDSLDTIAELIYICNDVGLDTIEAGCTIAVAMEGGAIDFGDDKGAISLLKEVGKGTPLGRIIGNGTAVAAQAFGVSRVPVVKRQAMPAYEPRAVKGIGITYATSTMGADHTAGYTIAPEILGVGGSFDPLDKDKAELSRAFQATTAFIDCTGYCLFIAFAILDIAEGFEGMVESVNGVSGLNWTADDVVRVGDEVLKTERAFNKAAGFTAADDRLPEFMKHEPLPPHNTVFDVPNRALDRVHAAR